MNGADMGGISSQLTVCFYGTLSSLTLAVNQETHNLWHTSIIEPVPCDRQTSSFLSTPPYHLPQASILAKMGGKFTETS